LTIFAVQGKKSLKWLMQMLLGINQGTIKEDRDSMTQPWPLIEKEFIHEKDARDTR
jgi:hypothetical protein